MKTYSIKPLVWTQEHERYHYADSALAGHISVIRIPAGWVVSGKHIPIASTLEAAKLAAERWYIEQIEQALTLTEQGE